MKKLILISLLSILSSFSVLSLNKTALVIGNQNYSNMSKLTTPKNEAIQMKDALERLGFEVIIILDGTEDGILDALYEFEDLLKERGGLALFHYGGHGVQVNDSNYIIPVDARIPDERRVRTNAIDVDEVLGVMEMSGSQTNIVILDACRDNPLPSSSRSSSRGLAVVANQPPDSIIVYSADAGTTAQDGLFTPTLLKYIEIPGLEIGDILKKVRRDVRTASGGKQRTGEYNQLESDIYLAGNNITQTSFDNSLASNVIDKSISFDERYGTITINSSEAGILYINGEKIGSMKANDSKTISQLPIDTYSLEYVSGNRTEKNTINFLKSDKVEIHFEGKRIEKDNNHLNIFNEDYTNEVVYNGRGRFHITSIPSGASVKIDGKELKTLTPFKVTTKGATKSLLIYLNENQQVYIPNIEIQSDDLITISVDFRTNTYTINK